MIKVEIPGPETIDDNAHVTVNVPFYPPPLHGSKAWAMAREVTIGAALDEARARGIIVERTQVNLASTRCDAGHLHIIAVLRGPIADA